MRPEPNNSLDIYRKVHPNFGRSPLGMNYGYFEVILKGQLRIISSGSDKESGWEHVSISHQEQVPTWKEMCYIKELFWRDDETVLQLKKSMYINCHLFTLHLWKKIGKEVELPPRELL